VTKHEEIALFIHCTVHGTKRAKRVVSDKNFKSAHLFLPWAHLFHVTGQLPPRLDFSNDGVACSHLSSAPSEYSEIESTQFNSTMAYNVLRKVAIILSISLLKFQFPAGRKSDGSSQTDRSRST